MKCPLAVLYVCPSRSFYYEYMTGHVGDSKQYGWYLKIASSWIIIKEVAVSGMPLNWN